MWNLLKRLLQLILFLIWSTILVNLILLSSFTFILFNICLTIFLFWFILTSIGWTVSLIPILKYVFIPWYRRQCRLWTKNNQQSRFTVAFFHPNCNNKSHNERILWYAIQSIIKKYKNDIHIIIYTGDIQNTSEEILQNVKQYFDIDLEISKSSITFIYLQSHFLLKTSSLFKKSIASIVVSFEALIRFIPDVYIDTIGYAFTYPCFYYLASIPIISYIQHPIIPNDILEKTTEQYPTSFRCRIQLIYYEIFTYIYSCCVNCSEIISCNSLYTKKSIELTWELNDVRLIYPPCDIEQFLEAPLNKQMRGTIVSIGEFRLEKNYELQIRAFNQLLKKKPEYREKLKLILIGNAEDNQEKEYIEQLKILINNLNIKQEVELKFNISFEELKTELNQALIGLHTMKNEQSGIDIVQMMAAGLIVLAHRSGSPKTDIIKEGQTGFFACDIDSYVTTMEQILAMTVDEQHKIQEQARDSIHRFNRLNFERLFVELFDKILFEK